MALPQGIAFRATTGFVADGPNDYGEISQTANYPTTSTQGNTVGWEQIVGGTRDRNSTFDPRIAGIAYISSPATANYRIDLPAAGTYKVRCAGGDSGANPTKIELFDSTTSLGVLAGPGGPVDFYDATNTQYTAAAWPGSNTSVGKAFASTICRFRLGDTSSSGFNSTAAYVYIEAASGGGPALMGNAITSSTGTANVSITSNIVGAPLAFGQGSFGVFVTRGIAGSTALSLTGSTGPGILASMIGASAIFAPGSISVPGTFLVGSSVTSASGFLSNNVTIGLVGQNFTARSGMLALLAPAFPGRLVAGSLLEDYIASGTVRSTSSVGTLV